MRLSIGLLISFFFYTEFVLAQRANSGSESRFLHLVCNIDDAKKINSEETQLYSPLIRHNTTSTYFTLLSTIADASSARVSISFSTETLKLILRYTDALGEFIDLKKNRIDAKGFLQKYGGKTDVWLELLLKSTATLTTRDLEFLLNPSLSLNHHGFAVSETTLKLFPDYAKLMPSDMQIGDVKGNETRHLLSLRDKMRIKFFYAITHFDRIFLREKVILPSDSSDGFSSTVDLSKFFVYSNANTPDDESDDQYKLVKPIDEDECQRLVVETYKVMKSVLFMIEHLSKKPITSGRKFVQKNEYPQVEFVATPLHDPLLPLISNTGNAGVVSETLPMQFQYPQDATQLIAGALRVLEKKIGVQAQSIHPTESAFSEETLRDLVATGFKYVVLSDRCVNLSKQTKPRVIDTGRGTLILVLLNSTLSESIQNALLNNGDLEVFDQEVNQLLSGSFTSIALDIDERFAEKLRETSGKQRLKQFLERYSPKEVAIKKKKLSPIILTTPSEYINGNAVRGVGAHVLDKQDVIPTNNLKCTLNLSKWIEGSEVQLVWLYLALMRGDVAKSGVEMRMPDDEQSDLIQQAWRHVYACENAMWVRYFGSDNPIEESEKIAIDQAFRHHLTQVYLLLKKHGIDIEQRKFAPIAQVSSRPPKSEFKSTAIKFDGLIDESIWLESAGIFSPEGISIAKVYYGFDDEHLYFAIDGDESIDFSKLTIEFFIGSAGKYKLQPLDADEKEMTVAKSKKMLELRIPFESLRSESESVLANFLQQELKYRKDMYLGVSLTHKGIRYPKEGYSTLAKDIENQIEVIFELRAPEMNTKLGFFLSETQAELRGNQVKRKRLNDFQIDGDRIMNDGIFTTRLWLQKGERVAYIYYNGDQKEFDDTPRELRVEPDLDNPKRMIVRDYFGKKTR